MLTTVPVKAVFECDICGVEEKKEINYGEMLHLPEVKMDLYYGWAIRNWGDSRLCICPDCFAQYTDSTKSTKELNEKRLNSMRALMAIKQYNEYYLTPDEDIEEA